LIVVFEVAFLEDLILLPSPRVLLQIGVKVVSIALSEIFSFGSWKNGG
jgi:hypothetical protein